MRVRRSSDGRYVDVRLLVGEAISLARELGKAGARTGVLGSLERSFETLLPGRLEVVRSNARLKKERG